MQDNVEQYWEGKNWTDCNTFWYDCREMKSFKINRRKEERKEFFAADMRQYYRNLAASI